LSSRDLLFDRIAYGRTEGLNYPLRLLRPVLDALSSAFGIRPEIWEVIVYDSLGSIDVEERRLTDDDYDGVDFASAEGTEVQSVALGYVSEIKVSPVRGPTVVVTHIDGSRSVYAHLGDTNVEVGQVVTINTVVGLVGLTGVGTGAHLHFEYYDADGNRVDPILFLKTLPVLSGAAIDRGTHWDPHAGTFRNNLKQERSYVFGERQVTSVPRLPRADEGVIDVKLPLPTVP